ncbi:MAG: ABC transporter substrate-binding protein [Thermodesulfobacteriota bacterium]|nr:ABC transporter substrate-binding protein [Thermodesulfobacteriota bacterium]
MNIEPVKRKVFLLLSLGLIFIGASQLGAQQPKAVTFLTWKPNQPEVWDRLIERFHQEHPKIRVQVQVGPHSSTEYHAIVTQRLKNKDASVDVFFMDVIWPPEFASAGWALDLTPRFSKEEQRQFLTAPIAANTYHGKIYGIPSFIDAGLFYYRKDLLKKYGFDPPRSWMEMLTQGDVILKGEADPSLYVYSGQFKQYEGLVCDMLEFIWSRGGTVLNPAADRVLLTDPTSIEAITFVRDHIIGQAAPKGVVNYEEPESLELFIQGRAVFLRNWPYAWTVANDPDKSKVAGKVGVGLLPAFVGHSSASALGGWQFAISRWSKHLDEAWQFVQFMTSTESQKMIAFLAGRAPTRMAVYEDPEFQEKVPHLKAFLPAFEKARPRPMSSLYPMISQELQRFFSRAITNKKSDVPALAERASANIARVLQMEALTRP